jgi:hypothetical protein
MSQISGTCSSNSAQALFEQHMEQLQQRRLEENREAQAENQLQATELNPETGEKHVTEAGKGAFIDLYV